MKYKGLSKRRAIPIPGVSALPASAEGGFRSDRRFASLPFRVEAMFSYSKTILQAESEWVVGLEETAWKALAAAVQA